MSEAYTEAASNGRHKGQSSAHEALAQWLALPAFRRVVEESGRWTGQQH